MTKVGFTGTQKGMTSDQIKMVDHLLSVIDGSEFHHGDCVGADETAAELAKKLKYLVISHPPTNNSKRAFFNSDFEFIPKPYLDRNKNIVEEIEILIATPFEKEEQLRSGTWSTIRYAKKKSRKIVIVDPEGNLEGF